MSQKVNLIQSYRQNHSVTYVYILINVTKAFKTVQSDLLCRKLNVVWCENNHLILDVSKTKKMSVDFRRNRNMSNTIFIT